MVFGGDDIWAVDRLSVCHVSRIPVLGCFDTHSQEFGHIHPKTSERQPSGLVVGPGLVIGGVSQCSSHFVARRALGVFSVCTTVKLASWSPCRAMPMSVYSAAEGRRELSQELPPISSAEGRRELSPSSSAEGRRELSPELPPSSSAEGRRELSPSSSAEGRRELSQELPPTDAYSWFES